MAVDERFHPGIGKGAESADPCTVRRRASSFATQVMGERPALAPDWTNARREIPSGWPPADAMPLTGDLLGRTVSKAREDRIESIFIRSVTAAVKSGTSGLLAARSKKPA